MAGITTRGAVAAFHLTLIQLLEAAGVVPDIDLSELCVHVNYKVSRLDIAKLASDGQIEQWICGFSIDPRDVPTFGTPVGLPGTDDATKH